MIFLKFQPPPPPPQRNSDHSNWKYIIADCLTTNRWMDHGNMYMYILHRHMNVEIGTEAALFPEKEYIMGIFFAVHRLRWTCIHKRFSALKNTRLYLILLRSDLKNHVSHSIQMLFKTEFYTSVFTTRFSGASSKGRNFWKNKKKSISLWRRN